MRPVVAPSREIERAGIRAVQDVFESCGCIFQEISQQNDFGKDAYIDLVDGNFFSPFCVAVQIKSGKSYRTELGDYFIPLDRHASSWRDSTVPVFGLVYDPEDKMLRWVDLTGYLRENPGQSLGRVCIPRSAILDRHSLNDGFKKAAKTYASGGIASIALKLLSEESQEGAVFDSWALGRSDARFLILLRRLILHLGHSATRRAIWALSHATPHPDIFWTDKNWIPEEVKFKLQTTFRWSTDEIVHLFMAVDPEEWGRGTLGQSLHMLLSQDYYFGENFDAAIRNMLAESNVEHAISLIFVVLHAAEDPSAELERIMNAHAELQSVTYIAEIQRHLKEYNQFDIY